MTKDYYMNELVSVIVPIYNAERYLKTCLECLRQQTYSNIEIVLVNDGSVDKSLEICEEYKKKDSRIKVISQMNKGLAGARNTGIRCSKGKYIIFLDADDYIATDYIDYLKSMIVNDVDLSMCMLKVTDHYEKNRKIGKDYSVETIDTHEFFRRSLNSTKYTSVCGKMFEKEFFKGVLFPEGMLHEDIYILADLMKNVKAINVGSESGYYYVKHAGSITTSKFTERKFDLNISNERYTQEILNLYPDLRQATEMFLIHGYSILIKQIPFKQKSEYSNYINTGIKKARENLLSNLRDSMISKGEKALCVVTSTNYILIKLLWYVYDRIKFRVA